MSACVGRFASAREGPAGPAPGWPGTCHVFRGPASPSPGSCRPRLAPAVLRSHGATWACEGLTFRRTEAAQGPARPYLHVPAPTRPGREAGAGPGWKGGPRGPQAVEAACWPGLPQGEAAAQAQAGWSTGDRAGQVSHGPGAAGTLGPEPAVLRAGVSCARRAAGAGTSSVPWPGSSQALEIPDSGGSSGLGGWAPESLQHVPVSSRWSPGGGGRGAQVAAGGRPQGGSPSPAVAPQPGTGTEAPRREDGAAAASRGGKDPETCGAGGVRKCVSSVRLCRGPASGGPCSAT